MGAEQAWLLAAIPGGMFLVIALLGSKLPRGGDYLGVLATGAAFVLFFVVLADFLDTPGNVGPVVQSISWSEIGDFRLRMGIYVDPITITMFGCDSWLASLASRRNRFAVELSSPGRGAITLTATSRPTDACHAR